jgi:subtilisin family serine protease
MSDGDLNFQRLKRKGSIIPFIIAALLIFATIFLLRNCNSPNQFWNGSAPGYGLFPDNPNTLQPIDTTKIIIPDDPLKRPIISDLLNVYVTDTTDLKGFASEVINSYISDSLKVTYYAEAYKRVQFKVPTNKQKAFKDRFKKDFPSIKFVCYESILSSKKTKTDPGFSNKNYDWFYEQIGLFEAWKTTMGDPTIKVAVIDDSFDPSHKELINQIELPWNVFEYSNDIKTYNNKLKHGTHVAGTVAGEINNGAGISGVAPKCKIIPIQIANSNGMMTTSSILDGIFYALKNKANIINMSLGADLSTAHNLTEEQQKVYARTIYKDEAAMWNEVYEIASKEGVVIVQAAGNSSVIAALDPMKRSKISITVGASDRNKRRAKFSNYGQKVDIYAPGTNIYSCIPNQKFEMLDGTSMASPIVAGCVALIKSINNSLSTSEIKELINTTAEEVNGELRFIQIDKLLQKIQAL